ncbi:esterase family protein [Streptococcus sp. X16XC17]|uniref:alpha/beta hydrolase n=1 Tax=unclassified Streptococcus TaxID=2608887 RepID=UPI00066FCA2A|nr:MULTISPECIES: alpha/beta hydrolase family protein [unclassified Streptococcus]TCD46492.1 esterase family protein [Streptococcus sp. X16XC17]
MAFIQIEYYSESLGQFRQVEVLYPDASEVTKDEATSTAIPVLYLLHGMSGNQHSWTGRTHLTRLVRYTNLIVVMPNTENGWYTNTKYGVNYYDAIATELPQVMRRFFPNMTDKREKTFIAGLSMGGYGAFKLAFLTNQYAMAGSFSGTLQFDMNLRGDTPQEKAYWKGVFGEDEEFLASDNHLLNAAKKADGKTKFYAWCGQGDFLFPANETAIADFKTIGIEVDYRTNHGTHDWYYWEKQIELFLEMLPIDYVKEERLS